MSTVTTLPFSRPFTRADLEHMPDDGHRYELIDGTLLVSPAPSFRHQRAVANLHLLLAAACPADLVVMLAPFTVGLADDTELQPDLLVAPRSQFTDGDLPGPPLLAVEVLSASTRRIDLLLKRDRLQAAGVPSYWLVDPDEPSLTALQLVGDAYREAAVVRGEQTWTAEQPFPVTICPDDLPR
jgi:Uma2 family endonuclease